MMRHRAFATLALLAFGLGVGWVGCDYDPVPQEAIEELPPEDADGPSELHRAGQPCALCHSDYWDAQPHLAMGGTVYEQNPATGQLIPVEGVFVTMFDSAGASQKACTNAAGNFYVALEDWPDAKFPMTVQVGNRLMRSLIGRDRSCATCHRLATQPRIDADPTVNPSTGEGRDSAGAILVERDSIPPEERCGPNPAGAVSSSAATGGGAMGVGGAGAGGVGGMGGGT